MTTAFPLAWPDGWPRTPLHERRSGKGVFVRGGAYGNSPWSFIDARDALQLELDRVGRSGNVLSTNFDIGRNGPLEGRGRRPDDQGVAIYFTRKGSPYVMACDRFSDAEGNMRSLTLALEAMRQLERHGGGVMLERAFQGFTALPSPDAERPRAWREVLGFTGDFATAAFGISPDEAVMLVRDRYRKKAAELGAEHPGLLSLNLARDAAIKEILG